MQYYHSCVPPPSQPAWVSIKGRHCELLGRARKARATLLDASASSSCSSKLSGANDASAPLWLRREIEGIMLTTVEDVLHDLGSAPQSRRKFDPNHSDVREAVRRFARGSRWYQMEADLDLGVRSPWRWLDAKKPILTRECCPPGQVRAYIADRRA